MELVVETSNRPARLLYRLLNAVGKQLSEVEALLAGASNEGADQSKVLSALARTLDTLVSVERRVQTEEEAPDTAHLRAELVARLAKLEAEAEAGVTAVAPGATSGGSDGDPA